MRLVGASLAVCVAKIALTSFQAGGHFICVAFQPFNRPFAQMLQLQRASCSRKLVVRPANALTTKTRTSSSSKKAATSSRRTQNGRKTTSSKTAKVVTDDSSSPLGLQYLASSAAAVVAGAGFTLAPHQVIEALGGQQVLNFTETSAQVYGAYWILVAAAAYRLAAAADSGRLASPTYARLNLFISLFLGASATSLLAGVSSGDLGAAPAGAAAAALLAAAGTTFVSGWRAGGDDSGDVSSSLAGAAAGFGDGLKQSFKAGRGLVGAFYSLSFWEALILGVALLFGPILPTVAVQDVSGTSAVIKNLVGEGTLLYAGIVWLLLDAADRGRLGASTFRALNAAAGAVSVAVAAICVAGQAGGVATNLTNQAVVIVSCGLTASVFLGLAAKPPSDE